VVKEKYIKTKITNRNIKKYSNLGYIAKIDEYINLSISDIPQMSKIIITAICELCKSERKLMYSKYNTNRNRGGFYSCKKCSGTKRRKTNSDKYGVEYISQTEENRQKSKDWMSSEEFKDKSIETINSKWGVTSYSKTKEFKEMISKFNKENSQNQMDNREKTCLSKYGYKSVLEIPNLKENAMYEKYGSTYSYNVPSIREKIIQTNLERYNGISPFSSKSIRIKSRETISDRYGVDNPFQSEEIKEKIKKTLVDKYGVDNPMKNGEIFRKSMSNKSRAHKMRYIDDLSYQSTYELDFIKFCQLNKIEVLNGPVIKYGENHRYYSDFYLPKYNIICEIKSNYTFENDKEKNILKQSECIKQGYDFIFLIDKNYKILIKIIDDKI
jgi:hypothetical protein